MTLCYFIREKKENMCKWILNKLDIGKYLTVLDQSEFTYKSKLIRDPGFNLLLQKLIVVLFFCSSFRWVIEM